MKKYFAVVLILLGLCISACGKTDSHLGLAKDSYSQEIQKSNPEINKVNEPKPGGELVSNNNIGEFSADDIEVLGVKIDMERESVEKVLGKPARVGKQYEEAFGENILYTKK